MDFELLSKYKIDYPKFAKARTPADIIAAGKKLGFPLAMKMLSPDVQHKSDKGGVILDIKGLGELEKAGFLLLERYRDVKVEGVLLQRMAGGKDSVELIIGGKKDAQFGQLIMLGLGGIFVEVLKDVTFRVCPITEDDARQMVHELKSYPILAGARGRKPVNERALIATLMKVSKLLMNENPKEFDINPLIINSEECTAVDMRIIK
ncbi:MAG: acetate--CoA ligase family protein [Candidatus Micrarchaeota archaeon]|nr:acetate--CoA ligase family protein [Candidatus Micrarchaeota archaeon]